MAQLGKTMTGPDGKLRVWVPDDTNSRNWEYLNTASGFPSGEAALQADLDSGQGSYVPASYVEHMPKLLKAFIITGLASMGVTGGAALAGGFGGAGGAGGTVAAGGGAAPSLGVPVTVGGLPGAVGGGAVAGGGTAGGAGTLGTLAKLRDVGSVLTNYAQGAAQGREHEANLNLSTDQLRQRQVESERQDQIERAKTNADLEAKLRQQQAMGHLLAQGPDTLEPPDFLKGRVKPITMTDYSALGKQQYDEATKRLLNGPNQLPPTVPTPPMTPQPNESLLDKLMRFSGLMAGGAGAFSNYRPPTTGGR